MLVWTNVRRYTDWWSRLIDASAVGNLPGCFSEEEDTEGGSSIVRDARLPAPAGGPALTVPTWRELDHDSAVRDEVFAATGIRSFNAE